MSELRFRLQLGLQDRYRVERFIGRGGMAEVFLATDLASSRQVAIKVLRPEAAALFGPARFLREIRTVSDLRHPNLLGLLDSGESMDLLYYVMPYAEGGSLRDLLDAQGQIPVERAAQIVGDVAAALDVAHADGVVHRDLKPQNILFSNGHALVADFGIARLVREIGPERLSETGIVLGTPHYMSPEQSLGNRRVDQRADVYGLGCVLYEMLAGVPPFTGPTSQAVQARHVHDKMPPLRTLRPTLPRAAEDAVRRALAKVPADRFAGAGDFARAFTAGTRGTPVRELRLKRPLAWLGAGLLVGLIALGVWWTQVRQAAPGGRAAAYTTAPPSWIIVADFEGPPSDPEIADATREMVCAMLDQSKFCASVPRGQIRNALAMAGKPPHSRLDPELARELAYRRSIRAVLEGSVKRLGPGYAIVVRLVEADSARVLATLSETARDQNDLIDAVSRICVQVTRRLGGDPASIRGTRRAVEIITPSFAAYRKFVESGKYLFSEPRRATALLYEAIALDPDFASAWEGLFWHYGVLGNDSAQIAGREALRRPERLTESARLNIEAAFADERGDFAEAFDLYRRAVAANPAALGPRNNRGNLLLSLGRYDEAIQEYRDARSISALPIPVLDLNEFLALLASGRVDEAEQLQRRITAIPDIAINPLMIAAARGNWGQIDQLARSFASDSTALAEVRVIGQSFLAIPAAVRGSVEEADRALGRSSRISGEIGHPRDQRQDQWARLLLRRVSAADVRAPLGIATDTALIDLVIRGMEAADRGDVATARQFAARIQQSSNRRIRGLGGAPAVLESRIAGLQDDWRRSRDLVLPIARARGVYGSTEFTAGRVSICWQLAEAFEHLGQPDSAATYLGLALDPTGDPGQILYDRGLAWSFLHRRLASLYALTGRIDVAEFHLGILAREFTRPDPGLRAMVEDTRREVVATRAMATPGGEAAVEAPRP